MQTGAAWSGGNAVDGIIDEVRISNVVRSADWIATEYNNQSDPANFHSVCAKETAPAPTVTTVAPASGADHVGDADLTPNNLTVEAWIKMDTLPSANGFYQDIVYKQQSGAPFFSYQLRVHITLDRPEFLWKNTAGTQYVASLQSGALSPGAWYHITGVHDASANILRIYVNGSDANTTAPTTTGTILDSD